MLFRAQTIYGYGLTRLYDFVFAKINIFSDNWDEVS